MKRIYLFLCFSFISVVLILTSITLVASENSEKMSIEQSLEYLEQKNYNMAIKSLEKALLSLREKAQLELNELHFTENEALGFGMYDLRKNNTFARGETFYIYVEPKNFTTKEIEENLFEIHIKEDLYILDMEGNILWGQKDFLDYHIFSHRPNNEIFITNAVTQDTPFPQGEYQFQLVVKDVFSQKTVEQTIKFIVD